MHRLKKKITNDPLDYSTQYKLVNTGNYAYRYVLANAQTVGDVKV